MSVNISAEDWFNSPPAALKQSVYECKACGSEFDFPKQLTKTQITETQRLMETKSTREPMLLLILCVLLADYSVMLALSIGLSILFLRDIQGGLSISGNVKRGRCPHCLGSDYHRNR